LKGSNAKQNKATNLRLVLSQIVTLGPISRAEIARNTQLTKQTITNMVEALLSVNLIAEVGIKRSEGAGKPSKMLCLNKHAAYTLAIRITAQSLELSVHYLNGECLTKSVINLLQGWTPEQIAHEFNHFINQHNIEHKMILAAGLCVHPSEGDTLTQYQSSLALQSALSQKLAMPIASETTASACAAYQMLFGEAKTLHSFTYIHIGHKIEAAVVYDRQIMLGQNGLTGALGEIFVTPETNQTTGELGTLNQFASVTSLKQYVEQQSKVSGIHLKLLDPREHAVCKRWIARAAEPLRIAIHTLESLLNTQSIIIGGDLGEACLDGLISELRPYIPSIAQLGERSIVRLIKVPNQELTVLAGISTLPLHASLNEKSMQTLYFSPTFIPSRLQKLIYMHTE